MLIVFMDNIKGIIHKKFALACQTVNSAYYCDVLWQLRENMQRLCPRLWRQKRTDCCIMIKHHLTLPFHQGIFDQKQRDCHPQSTLLTSLGPCSFFLFPQLEIKLKVHDFYIIEVVETESQVVLNTLTEQDFQDAFKKLQKRWEWYGGALLRG
jgi:hypothetical protein